MYTQKSRSSKIVFLIMAFVMAIASVSMYVLNFTSTSKVFAAEEITANITKSSSTVYYRGQIISIDLDDGTDAKEYTNIPDLTSWQLTVYYGKKKVNIDMQEALINNIKGDTSKDRISVENFSTNLSASSSSSSTAKGEFRITCTLSASTLQELGYTSSSSVAVSVDKISYSVYESKDAIQGAENVTKILNSFNNVLQKILSPIIGIMLAVGMIFAIYLGFKLAKANNAEQREEAKKRIIYTVIGIAIGVALIIIFNLFATYSVQWLGGDSNFFHL